MFLCNALIKMLNLVLRKSPTADSTPHPIEEPATKHLCGKDYISPEEEKVWDVDYQSQDTLTSKLSILRLTGKELKDMMTWGVNAEADDTLMPVYDDDLYTMDLQPLVWEVDNEVQEMPNFHASFLEFLSEPEAQRFLALYSFGNLLGNGGCGSVYEGVRKKDRQQVAIKYIPKNNWDLYINIPGETSKLHIEVALMKIVSKPPLCKNVLQLLDWFEMSNCLLLVLERPVPCMDVYSLCMEKEGVLDEPLAKMIMLQVIKAVHHCHNRRVFHSDIKAENLLFNPDTLNIKLIDFGCGTLWQDTPYKDYAGTPDFCPPEWILQKQYHAYPATVWSLGVLLFSLVCGEMPFTNEEEIVDETLNLTPGLSEACCHLIKWCLEQDPTKRPSLKQISRHRWFKKSL